MAEPITLHASATEAGRPLTHFWSTVVGAGRANEGLRADWQRHLAAVRSECGFEYVRFHGLLHDDMFVYTEREDGTPVLNFQYVDALFDALLDAGVRPFVELGFSPRALARETETVFWWGAHGAPPVDLDRWSFLVRSLVEHWVARYGLAEVREWYFEVWNEANLRGFFRGTRSEYLTLYAASARAVKAVDERLRVGGPATSNFVPDARFDGETEDFQVHEATLGADLDSLDWKPVWLDAFLDFCEREHLPVDFVSTHPYPTDWALDEHGQGARLTREVDATPKDLALLRRLVDASAFPDAEIHLTEWNSSSSPRDFTHDTVPAAVYVVRSVLRSIGTVDSLAYWTFTDVFEEGGAGDEMFHGGFGMITLQGVPKPTFHAYRMLHALGDTLLATADDGVVTRHDATGRVTALVHHYPAEVTRSVPASFDDRTVADETEAAGPPRDVALVVEGLAPGAVVELETLDPEHANPVAAWRAMGAPSSPTREQTALLDAAARDTRRESVVVPADGVLRVERTLAPWSLLLARQVA
ncbi:GH39 family glycosyl hydrolase [Cellulosimicrobium sp. CpK407]|uniref:GH39 family glycosyl hydrolase n=1 Tax=Cellulosimicrobium sp. CpK407 TaxID=3229847 RepID=UPI003F344742